MGINKRIKFVAIDIAGIALIILAGLFGWLPGPGGLPLLIAGLGLLSINHQWAKRWLETIQNHGLKLSDTLFNGSRTVTVIIDIVGIACIGVAVIIIFLLTGTLAKTAGIWLGIIAIVLLLGNRKRLQRIFKKQ